MKYLNSFDNMKDYIDGMLNINKTYEPSISLVNENIIFSKNIDWMFIVNITNEELNKELKIIHDPMSQIDKVYIDNELIEFNNHNENPELNRLKYTFDELGNHVIMIKFIDSIRTDIPLGGYLYRGLLDNEILACITECTIFNRHDQYQWGGATKLKKVNLKCFEKDIDWAKLNNTSLFQGATNIKEIYFPKSIKCIPNNTVYELNNVEKWNLSELSNLETVSYNSLSGTRVSEIILPKNLKYLGSAAFGWTKTTINKIDLGNVEEIDDSPFIGCTLNNLDIVIPATVKKIKRGLFGTLGNDKTTGVHSIKFMNPNPINVESSSYSNMIADAEIIYVPKGSKIAYANSGYCTSGYNGAGANDLIEGNAQYTRNSYLQSHPLLEEPITYEEATTYAKTQQVAPVPEITSSINSFGFLQQRIGYISYVLGENGIPQWLNDGKTIEEIETIILGGTNSTYTDLENNVYDWKYFMIDENTNHFKEKYIIEVNGNDSINLELLNADYEARTTELVKPWIDYYYAERGPDGYQQYNENILAQADIEADRTRQQLRTQYGYDRIVEFDL